LLTKGVGGPAKNQKLIGAKGEEGHFSDGYLYEWNIFSV